MVLLDRIEPDYVKYCPNLVVNGYCLISKSQKVLYDSKEIVQLKKVKGTVIQIEKALTKDRLRVSKVSWKFRISTIYNFCLINP